MTGAVSVGASTAFSLEAGPGASPRTALQGLRVAPVPIRVAKAILERSHYLHSLPGATKLAFGVFAADRLLGVITLGSGPTNAYRLVEGAKADDCIALTRLWLSDELPANSESRVIGIVLRSLARHTCLKFVVTYADPMAGHLGIIYQASNWIYVGTSQATPLYDMGDGIARHSRSLSNALGTRSVRHFLDRGVPIQRIPQAPKHRYIYFLDPAWRSRLRAVAVGCPRGEAA